MTVSLRVVGFAALAASSLAGGCGTQPSPPGADHQPGPTTEPTGGKPTGAKTPPEPPPAPPGDPTTLLVNQAFGGAPPAFPLLASTGNEVAMSIASPIGGSTIATYRVVTFSNWTNLSDAWGSSAVDSPVVDPVMTTMLLDRAMGEPAPLPDARVLADRANAIIKRLRAGGFSPFDGAVTTLGPGDTTVGSIKLRTSHGADAELTVHLLDAAGRELAANTLQPHPMGLVADVACVSTPVARRAWFDARRKRVLIEVGWNAGANGCALPDPEYGMWPVP